MDASSAERPIAATAKAQAAQIAPLTPRAEMVHDACADDLPPAYQADNFDKLAALSRKYMNEAIAPA